MSNTYNNILAKLKFLEDKLLKLENDIKSIQSPPVPARDDASIVEEKVQLPPPPPEEGQIPPPPPPPGQTININVAPPSPALTPTDTPESPKPQPSLLSQIQQGMQLKKVKKEDKKQNEQQSSLLSAITGRRGKIDPCDTNPDLEECKIDCNAWPDDPKCQKGGNRIRSKKI